MTKLKTRKGQSPKGKTQPKSIATGVKMLPVADMHVSKLNMRHGKTAPDIDDIYPSILQGGINQSLLVRKEGKTWGVIAGRRRLFALKRKEKETGKTQTAPCVVMESGNIKAAREASLLENVARVPATQIEQFAAYKGLVDSGKDISEIAATFAIPEKSVKRVLALANLLPELLALYESEDIRTGTVQALTMATKDQQTKWLALYHSDEYAPTDYQLKEWLIGGAQIETSAALFDTASFEGHIISDLFGDTEYFADPDQFWPLQNTAIATAVSEWKAEGWTDVVLLERGQYFESYEHGKRSLEQGGKIYVAVGHDGTVTPHIGYLPNAAIKKIDAILGLETGGKSKAISSRPEMSGPMQTYIALHRHAAIRSCLLEHPKIALRLIIAHMLVGAKLWTIEPQKTKTRKEITTESVASARGAARFESERKAVYALLNVEQAKGIYTSPKYLVEGDITTIFARLLELKDDAVMQVMTFAMAESLAAGSRIMEAITYAVPVDMGALWEPDDAFFELLRDKSIINAMVKDIAGKGTADGALTETGKLQKQIIRNRMAGHGVKDASPDWRPKWMQIPATHYSDKDTCPPAKADATVSKIMMAIEKPKTKKAA